MNGSMTHVEFLRGIAAFFALTGAFALPLPLSSLVSAMSCSMGFARMERRGRLAGRGGEGGSASGPSMSVRGDEGGDAGSPDLRSPEGPASEEGNVMRLMISMTMSTAMM